MVRPHALTALKGVDGIQRSFEYDANGNLVRNENRLASWTSYNLPKTLEGYGQREEYWYDAEHERIKQVSSKYGTQLYFNPGKGSGLFYEKQTGKDGKVEHKHYLTALGDVIGEVVKRDNPAAGQAAEEERYWVKDHLGSNRAILGSSGQLLESLGFDAWGKRRYASGQTDAANPGIAGQTTDRGYTGHEHLDELGLINMNARIYDPLLGRFLSPDPQISAPDDMQDFNRYSYAWNNPLSYTDPSGEDEDDPATGGRRDHGGVYGDTSPMGYDNNARAHDLGGNDSGWGEKTKEGRLEAERNRISNEIASFERNQFLALGPAAFAYGATVTDISIAGGFGYGSNYGSLPGFNETPNQRLSRQASHAFNQMLNALGVGEPGEEAEEEKGPSVEGDKQGKHIPGHKNFIPGRSELTDPDPQKLVDKHAGKGQQVGNTPVGQPGSKERVDFGKDIGNYVDPSTGKKEPTSKGMIHYGSRGVHIVPSRP